MFVFWFHSSTGMAPILAQNSFWRFVLLPDSHVLLAEIWPTVSRCHQNFRGNYFANLKQSRLSQPMRGEEEVGLTNEKRGSAWRDAQLPGLRSTSNSVCQRPPAMTTTTRKTSPRTTTTTTTTTTTKTTITIYSCHLCITINSICQLRRWKMSSCAARNIEENFEQGQIGLESG